MLEHNSRLLAQRSERQAERSKEKAAIKRRRKSFLFSRDVFSSDGSLPDDIAKEQRLCIRTGEGGVRQVVKKAQRFLEVRNAL